MLPLDDKYLKPLEELANDIQGSDALAAFLETEEEAEYKVLIEQFEPRIGKLYAQCAANDPLQLVSFEQIILNAYFEGLFLPKILGYSVLRGQLNSQYKYTRPQNHFKNILMAIIESSNFEFIKKRIGQSVQMGFAFSSDIWTTDLIASVANKRLRYYLQQQKLDKYRELYERQDAYTRFTRQFSKEVFLTASFPQSFSDLKVEYPDLKAFLMARVAQQQNNETLVPFVVSAVQNEAFFGTTEHVQLLALAMNFFVHTPEATEGVKNVFDKVRTEVPEFATKYLAFIVEMHINHFNIDSAAELHAASMVDSSVEDEISEYYAIASKVHTEGYKNEAVMDAVKAFYNNHEGLSTINGCLRRLIFANIFREIKEFKERDYFKYFELSRVFTVYMRIFGNEQFSQSIRDVSLEYIRKCLVKFIDKRAKEYQDVKRFVQGNFAEWHFIKEKDIVEMFKTRRKRKDA